MSLKKNFGLIGFTLSHSFSKKYFDAKFEQEKLHNCHFSLYPLPDINDFINLVKNERFLLGLSVTIPYKKQIIPFLNELDETAKKTGAVNSIKIIRNQENIKTIGFNTDIWGFEQSLLKILIKNQEPRANSQEPKTKSQKPKAKSQNSKAKNFILPTSDFRLQTSDFQIPTSDFLKALILGTGGASLAVSWVLQNLNINYLKVSRNPSNENEISYNHLTNKIISEHLLIINTTPLGMFPDIDEFPDIPYSSISKNHILFDLTYNPEETIFLLKGKQQGAFIQNGLEMLHLQAEKSWEIWKD